MIYIEPDITTVSEIPSGIMSQTYYWWYSNGIFSPTVIKTPGIKFSQAIPCQEKFNISYDVYDVAPYDNTTCNSYLGLMYDHAVQRDDVSLAEKIMTGYNTHSQQYYNPTNNGILAFSQIVTQNIYNRMMEFGWSVLRVGDTVTVYNSNIFNSRKNYKKIESDYEKQQLTKNELLGRICKTTPTNQIVKGEPL